MNTNTSLKYLAIAIDKASGALHPNFRRALEKKPKQLLMHNNIRMAAAKAFDANPGNPRGAIIATIRALKSDMQAYTTFVKGVASDVAFAAHMDCNAFERNIDVEAIDAGIDAMGEAHSIDVTDIPAADIGEASRSVRSNASASENVDKVPHECIANSVADAYAAVEAAQAWLTQAFTGLDEDQAAYWGVDGLVPLMQQVDDHPTLGKVYSPIRDFDTYREAQTAAWKAKQATVQLTPDTEEAMANS